MKEIKYGEEREEREAGVFFLMIYVLLIGLFIALLGILIPILIWIGCAICLFIAFVMFICESINLITSCKNSMSRKK